MRCTGSMRKDMFVFCDESGAVAQGFFTQVVRSLESGHQSFAFCVGRIVERAADSVACGEGSDLPIHTVNLSLN